MYVGDISVTRLPTFSVVGINVNALFYVVHRTYRGDVKLTIRISRGNYTNMLNENLYLRYYETEGFIDVSNSLTGIAGEGFLNKSIEVNNISLIGNGEAHEGLGSIYRSAIEYPYVSGVILTEADLEYHVRNTLPKVLKTRIINTATLGSATVRVYHEDLTLYAVDNRDDWQAILKRLTIWGSSTVILQGFEVDVYDYVYLTADITILSRPTFADQTIKEIEIKQKEFFIPILLFGAFISITPNDNLYFDIVSGLNEVSNVGRALIDKFLGVLNGEGENQLENGNVQTFLDNVAISVNGTVLSQERKEFVLKNATQVVDYVSLYEGIFISIVNDWLSLSEGSDGKEFGVQLDTLDTGTILNRLAVYGVGTVNFSRFSLDASGNSITSIQIDADKLPKLSACTLNIT